MSLSSVPVFTVVKKYKEKYSGNAIDGDVFIVQYDEKIQNAGVYSAGQIIQLRVSAGIFFSSTEVNKVNVDAFTGGNRFAVYRKNGGIPQSFRENVYEAMSRCPEGNYEGYNCIEFVMELLDIDPKLTKSDCLKILNGTKPKGFKVVKNFSDDYNGNANLGDLFLVKNGPFGNELLHAGVCCSEKGPEIIQVISTSSPFKGRRRESQSQSEKELMKQCAECQNINI